MVDGAVKFGISLRRKGQVEKPLLVFEGDKHHAFCRAGGLLDQHHAKHKYIGICF